MRRSFIIVIPPWGTDTLFMITSDKMIPDPGVFEFKGVKTRGSGSEHPLEKLFGDYGTTSRGTVAVPTDRGWSVQRLIMKSEPMAGEPSKSE